MADKYPLLKTISLEDPSFLPGAREIAKKAMANGDASAGMNALFEYAAHRSSALAPTIRRASDATVADLGAQMSRVIDYLSATQPDLCARLLRGSPFNPMQYPNEVQQLFEAFNTIEAKAYVEGKSAPPDGYPVANPGGKGTDEPPTTATLAAVAQDFTPEELEAVREPTKATPRALCSAYKKWFDKITLLPSQTAAATWRDILFSQTP
jgi:hypothetical protein